MLNLWPIRPSRALAARKTTDLCLFVCLFLDLDTKRNRMADLFDWRSLDTT